MLSNVSKVTRNLKVSCLLLAIFTLCQKSEAVNFVGCDHTFNLDPGYSYLESPNYPQSYPPGSACRYKFVAPLNHYIVVNCTLNLPKGATNVCGTEYFYIDTDGDKNLINSRYFCGSGVFIRRSRFRSVVLAYESHGSVGLFQCLLHVKPQPCDCGWSINTKIVNGQDASVNEFPSMVALRQKNSYDTEYCAAVIISHRYMLTAAHCTRFEPNPASIIALVGRHNIQSTGDTKYAAVYYISSIIEHPGYNPKSIENDIAILVTQTDIEWSRAVGPICLPPYSNINNDFAYNYVDVIGWGRTSFAGERPAILQKVSVMVQDNEACRRTLNYEEIIYSSQICTYDSSGTHKDSCQHDSGGPVIYRNKRQFLVGIISHGRGCGTKRFAIGINTRITSFLPWIYANTGHSTCNISL